MRDMWLLVSRHGESSWARSEIRLREKTAKIVYLETLDEIFSMLDALNIETINVMVACEGAQVINSEFLTHLARLSQYAQVQEIVVATTSFEPGVVAQLFGAGVTEVVNMESNAREEAAEGNAEGVPIPEAEEIIPGRSTTVEVEDVVDADEIMVEEGLLDIEEPFCPAPVVSFVSGRGGVGKTQIVASLASSIASCGLRCAVVDADFGFGCLYALFGVEALCGYDALSFDQMGVEGVLEQNAMRIAPGLTLWGPCAQPEYAEIASSQLEQVIDVLRRESDIVLIDTPSSWTESTAIAVSNSDRCVIVCDKRLASELSLKRAIELASKLGIPRTKLIGLINRVSSASIDEENAVRLEMQSGLANHVRISEADTQTFGLMEVGKTLDALKRACAYAHGIDGLRNKLLTEMGLSKFIVVTEDQEQSPKRICLPWNSSKNSR